MNLRVALPILFIWASAALAAADSNDILTRGFTQMQAGDCPAVAETLQPLFTGKTPSQSSAYRLLSDCYSKTNQPGKALATLREGLKSSPGSLILQRTLGELLFHGNSDNPEAGALLQKSAEALPHDPESHHFYAQWAYLNNRESICVDQERQALAVAGSNEHALLQMHTLKALCEDKLDQAEAAGGDFRESNSINLKLPPFDPATALQYVDFLNRRGKDSEAQKIVDELLARAP
ncbi:MAG: hypothetical protein M3Y57_21690 [Acidobacteriota bacterium]|nr:hypothetical protein [Acidobacteriota bacterium]